MGGKQCKQPARKQPARKQPARKQPAPASPPPPPPAPAVVSFQEQRKQDFASLLNRLGDYEFTDPIPADCRQFRNVIIIGNVSCGKSSLVNKLFGTTLLVGVGDVTTRIHPVYCDGSTMVWDSPGSNNDFAFYDPHNLAFMHAAHLVIILYKDSLSTVSDIVLTVKKIKGIAGFVCARSQCDLFAVAGHVQARSLEQEMQRDRETLCSLSIPNCTILRTASVGQHDFDNETLKCKILGPS